ncbi:hypothetical protein VTO42DRAFT_5482 [Malbranchea cinnamomea]
MTGRGDTVSVSGVSLSLLLAWRGRHTIKGWVSKYQPDYLLILLGFNDLGMASREAKPDVKLLVSNVVHCTHLKGRKDREEMMNGYSIMLKEKLPSWFRWESPIAYVDVNTDYNCRADGCLDCTPNARREYHIARAFFLASCSENLDTPAWRSSCPQRHRSQTRGCPTACEDNLLSGGAVYHLGPSPERSRIRDPLPGEGVPGWWSEGLVYPNTHGSFQTWEHQVRALLILRGLTTWEWFVDNDVRSGWSALSSATAKLGTSQGPSNVFVEPRSNGEARHSLSAESVVMGGLPSAGKEVIVGGGTPGSRRLGSVCTTSTQSNGTTMETSYGVGLLFPITWNPPSAPASSPSSAAASAAASKSETCWSQKTTPYDHWLCDKIGRMLSDFWKEAGFTQYASTAGYNGTGAVKDA